MCSKNINVFGNPVDVTVKYAQFSHQQQPKMPRAYHLSEEDRVRINREGGMGKKVPQIALDLARSCTVLRNYFAGPINYGTRNPKGRKGACNLTSVRDLNRAMSNNSSSARENTAAKSSLCQSLHSGRSYYVRDASRKVR